MLQILLLAFKQKNGRKTAFFQPCQKFPAIHLFILRIGKKGFHCESGRGKAYGQGPADLDHIPTYGHYLLDAVGQRLFFAADSALPYALSLDFCQPLMFKMVTETDGHVTPLVPYILSEDAVFRLPEAESEWLSGAQPVYERIDLPAGVRGEDVLDRKFYILSKKVDAVQISAGNDPAEQFAGRELRKYLSLVGVDVGESGATISLSIDGSLPEDGYKIQVKRNKVIITGGNVRVFPENSQVPVSPDNLPLHCETPAEDHFEASFTDKRESWTYIADRDEDGHLYVWIPY